MSETATANRVRVTGQALAHARERYESDPTDANALEYEIAAINHHLALVTPVTV